MVQEFQSYYFMIEIKNFRYFDYIRVIPGLLGGHFYPFWGPFLTGVKNRVIFFGTENVCYLHFLLINGFIDFVGQKFI